MSKMGAKTSTTKKPAAPVTVAKKAGDVKKAVGKAAPKPVSKVSSTSGSSSSKVPVSKSKKSVPLIPVSKGDLSTEESKTSPIDELFESYSLSSDSTLIADEGLEKLISDLGLNIETSAEVLVLMWICECKNYG
ncbi:MAG: hypothetical protein IPK55_11615 [Streptococcus sp.]|nr:hypothetical protein [Streptococcus sp.]